VIAPRPSDDEGLRCQGVVDARMAELAAVIPPGTDAVCRHRDSDPNLHDAEGYFQTNGVVTLANGLSGVVDLIVVAYPGTTAMWRDIVAHEVGHAWDDSRWPEYSSLPRYREVRGASVIEPIYEDYADVFASVIGGITGASGAGLPYIGVPPPPEQVTVLCAEGLLPC
jgi:hypothetical protein